MKAARTAAEWIYKHVNQDLASQEFHSVTSSWLSSSHKSQPCERVTLHYQHMFR